MFFDDNDDFSSSSTKKIKIYKNGDSTQAFDLTVNNQMKEEYLAGLCETKLGLKPIQRLRLFTSEGLEISIPDLAYIKNGESLFASRGENFDRNSTLTEYQMIRTLGEGGFGEVMLATHKRSGDQVAIKFLKASSRVMANEIDRLFAEAETLKNLHHKNIVKVLNCFSQSSTQIAFVMEYLSGGELLEYVLQRKRLTEDEAREFFNQIAQAVAYCHRSKLIHCDLKLENILLESKDSKVVKVVDFGISGLCTNIKSGDHGGSLDYMAPDYFNGAMKSVHPGVDVWALGCMLYGMVCGKLPFNDDNEDKIIKRITHANYSYDEAGKKLSREVKDLIKRMLEVDMERRLTIHDVLDHPWVNKQKMEDEPAEEEEAKIQLEKKTTSTASNLAGSGDKAPGHKKAHTLGKISISHQSPMKVTSPVARKLPMTTSTDKSPINSKMSPQGKKPEAKSFSKKI